VLKGTDLKRKRVRALHPSIAAKCFRIRADVAQGELFRDLKRVTEKYQGECHQAYLRPLRIVLLDIATRCDVSCCRNIHAKGH
jgi:hypothetical protein